MAQTTWERPGELDTAKTGRRINVKAWIGPLVILAAVVYLVANGMTSGARYFITVDEVLKGDYAGKTVRISGAVIGDTIQYDTRNLIIDFTIVHIPQEGDNVARALYEAVNNPDAQRLKIHIENQVKPDLLQNEAQAIVTGKLGADGVFYATELLLKCPSRYEEAEPGKAIADPASIGNAGK